MNLPLSRVAACLGLAAPSSDPMVTGWSIDSRTAAPGDLFIALRGERFDGHDYVAEVLARGAAAALVERPGEGTRLVVPNTQVALEELGRQVRQAWGGTVIGVTGSAGKTTTKDVVAALVSTGQATGKTIGNLNNHIGVPLSILRLPGEARVAVLEMGMNHAGEIRHLCGIARPEIGVVTNVGYAHVENFADGLEGVAAAKRELIECLPADGLAVLNADDPRVASFPHARRVTFGLGEAAMLRAHDVELGEDGAAFTVDGLRFRTRLMGQHGVRNVLAGLAVARELGCPLGDLREAAAALEPGPMRGAKRVHEGVLIYDDCYNANPDAMRAMLDVLKETPARRRIAVLGEMRELGAWAEPLHGAIGEYAAASGVDVLFGIRGAARHLVASAQSAGMAADAALFFEEPEEAGRALRGVAQAGDAVLFKGSRGTRVELALRAFTGEGDLA